MNARLQRARVLDAEMQLQRAWLGLSLREIASDARESPLASLKALKLGRLGLSLFKYRSFWIAGIGLLVNLFRRHAKKESS